MTNLNLTSSKKILRNQFESELLKLVEIGFLDFIEKLRIKKMHFNNHEKLLDKFYTIVNRHIFIQKLEHNIYFTINSNFQGRKELIINKPMVIALIRDLLESGLFVARYSNFDFNTLQRLKVTNPYEQYLFTYAVELRKQKNQNQDYSDKDADDLREANSKLGFIDGEEFKREFQRIYKNFNNYLTRLKEEKIKDKRALKLTL